MKTALVLSLALMGLLAQAQDVPAHFQAVVGETVGKRGTLNADGSYRINIPRTDVAFTNSAGMPIPADMGLSTYMAMSGTAEKVLAVGDVAMLDDEIDRVIDALRAGGYEIVALHNHMTAEQPRLFFMHFQAVGQPAALAKTFRTAIDILGKATQKAIPPKTEKPKLDADLLSTIFGSNVHPFQAVYCAGRIRAGIFRSPSTIRGSFRAWVWLRGRHSTRVIVG